MKRFLRALRNLALAAVLVAAGAALHGCDAQALRVQAQVANGVALAANAALPPLVATYRAEGLAAVHASSTRADAETRLAVVRARWQGVWGVCAPDGPPGAERCRDGAWPALAAAHDAWALALERAQAGASLDFALVLGLVERLRTAWCGLRGALRPLGASLPEIPGLQCPTVGGP